WTRGRLAEAAAVIGVLLLLVRASSIMWERYPGLPAQLGFTLFPIIGYVGLRFGAPGASTLIASIAAASIPAAAFDLGPFARFSDEVVVLVLTTFLLLAWLSGQTLAAVKAEWADALERRLVLEAQLQHSQKTEAMGRLAG